MSKTEYHRADEKRFLDERGSSGPLAPNGLNPATIMEKAVRERIIDSYFYKEQCFAVNEADIVDRVVDHVEFIGGVTGVVQKPTPFLCLAFKLLQLAPSDAILDEYLNFGGEKFKYLRALAVFYIRLTRKDADVYQRLEPFLEDRRKLKRKGRQGMTLTYMDEFVDDLLTKDRVCATSLWSMRKRDVLEDLLEEEDQDEEMKDGDVKEEGTNVNGRSERSRSRSRTRSRSRSRSKSYRSRTRSRSRSPYTSRSRSRSREERSDHDRMDVDRLAREEDGVSP